MFLLYRFQLIIHKNGRPIRADFHSLSFSRYSLSSSSSSSSVPKTLSFSSDGCCCFFVSFFNLSPLCIEKYFLSLRFVFSPDVGKIVKSLFLSICSFWVEFECFLSVASPFPINRVNVVGDGCENYLLEVNFLSPGLKNVSALMCVVS